MAKSHGLCIIMVDNNLNSLVLMDCTYFVLFWLFEELHDLNDTVQVSGNPVTGPSPEVCWVWTAGRKSKIKVDVYFW